MSHDPDAVRRTIYCVRESTAKRESSPFISDEMIELVVEDILEDTDTFELAKAFYDKVAEVFEKSLASHEELAGVVPGAMADALLGYTESDPTSDLGVAALVAKKHTVGTDGEPAKSQASGGFLFDLPERRDILDNYDLDEEDWSDSLSAIDDRNAGKPGDYAGSAEFYVEEVTDGADPDFEERLADLVGDFKARFGVDVENKGTDTVFPIADEDQLRWSFGAVEYLGEE